MTRDTRLVRTIYPGDGWDVGPAGRMWLRLALSIEADPMPASLFGYPPELYPALNVVYRSQARPPLLADPMPLGPVHLRDVPGRVIVSFSGGKDSTAAALVLRTRGLSPLLFYVKNINPAYSTEQRAAERVAAALGMPLIVVSCHVKGVPAYVESPVKNQVIQAAAIDWAMANGGREFAMGNLEEDRAAELNPRAFGSDPIELMEAVAVAHAAMIDGYKWHRRLLRNDTDSMAKVLRYAPEVLPLIQSCMMPVRYKDRLANHNRKKYDVRLMPGRCGSCFKCAVEWLLLMFLGHVRHNEGMATHCAAIIRNAGPMVFGHDRFTVRQAVEQFIDPSLMSAKTWSVV